MRNVPIYGQMFWRLQQQLLTAAGSTCCTLDATEHLDHCRSVPEEHLMRFCSVRIGLNVCCHQQTSQQTLTLLHLHQFSLQPGSIRGSRWIIFLT